MSAMHDDWCPDCGCDELNCRCDEAFEDEWDCTHCAGDGICDEGADWIGGSCPLEAHACHACHGTGRRSDQRIF